MRSQPTPRQPTRPQPPPPQPTPPPPQSTQQPPPTQQPQPTQPPQPQSQEPTQPQPTQPPQPQLEPQPQPSQEVADVATDHVVEAAEANQTAAQNTAEAAKNAQTQDERQAVSDSAAKVDETNQRIAAALKALGVGQCGARTYKRVTARVRDALLAKLRSEGMAVTGNNPYNIDTRQYNVRLRAVWDPTTSQVKLIVTTGKGTEVIPFVKSVTCQDIWDKIDPIMKQVASA
jgi:hypothetical protein